MGRLGSVWLRHLLNYCGGFAVAGLVWGSYCGSFAMAPLLWHHITRPKIAPRKRTSHNLIKYTLDEIAH